MNKPAPRPLFKPGDRVHLKTDRGLSGAVISDPRPHELGYEYAVLMGGSEHWFNEDRLVAIPRRDHPRWVSRDKLVLELAIAKLRHPLSDALYSYRASRTIFEPYQFRPALKFLRSHNHRILIADEVGLGKTIEASIIYLELKARLDISRVLVLCPSRLTHKWKDELSNRFEETFAVLDANGLRQLFDDIRRLGPEAPFRAIVSFELFRRAEFIEELLEQQIPIDLLIVDEAHYFRNEASATYRLAETITNLAEAIVFLTATPLHLRNKDLFNLLNLLSPEEFTTHELFEMQLQPNASINRAMRDVATGDPFSALVELKRVEETALRGRFVRNPYYQEAIAQLSHMNRNASVADRVAVQWDLIGLNTLSSILTRTKKREVSTGAVRAPFSVKVVLTPAERRFYDAVLEQTRLDLARQGMSATGFGTAMKERQAASCLHALRERITESVARHRSLNLEIDYSPLELLATEEDSLGGFTEEVVEASQMLGETDTKFDLFVETVRRTLAEDETSKALVFSYFRGTLDYLQRQLKMNGFSNVDVIHGNVRANERRRIIEEFRSNPDRRILLSSEVGAEGLDFQFCDILINYDLPWNPMQVEQRIGRLDRFGQLKPRIRIYNFFIEDTVETRIFERLYQRIRLFEQSIGDLEDILGEEVRKLSREALQGQLTPQEQEREADLAAQRLERRQLEAQELEAHKDELLGQGHIFDQQIRHTIESGRIVTPDEIRALVSTFVREQYPQSRMSFDDQEPCATIEVDPMLATHLRRLIERRRIGHQVSMHLRSALSDRRRMPFTFDDELARQRPNLEFVTARHPLALAAREHWEAMNLDGYPTASLEVPGPTVEAGIGHFFCYMITVRGATTSVTLESVVVLDDGRLARNTGELLLRSIQDGSGRPAVLDGDESLLKLAALKAHSIMAGRRYALESETRKRNAALLSARIASVRATAEAKMQRVQQSLDSASDDRIQRMKTSELKNLEARLANKLEELEKGREVDVSSELLAGGRISIRPDSQFGTQSDWNDTDVPYVAD